MLVADVPYVAHPCDELTPEFIPRRRPAATRKPTAQDARACLGTRSGAAKGATMHLFDYLDSGNGYKVRLLLAQLGIDYGWTQLDIDAGATRTPEFLKRNPNGRVPTLELDDGHESQRSRTRSFGSRREGTPSSCRATALGVRRHCSGLFFEQYSHKPWGGGSLARLLRRRALHDRRHRAVSPTRMSRKKAVTISRRTRTCARGSPASQRQPGYVGIDARPSAAEPPRRY